MDLPTWQNQLRLQLPSVPAAQIAQVSKDRFEEYKAVMPIQEPRHIYIYIYIFATQGHPWWMGLPFKAEGEGLPCEGLYTMQFNQIINSKVSIPNFQFKDSMVTHPWWMGFFTWTNHHNHILWHVNFRNSTQIQPV